MTDPTPIVQEPPGRVVRGWLIVAIAVILSVAAAILLSLKLSEFSRVGRVIIVGLGVLIGPLFWTIGLTGSTPLEDWPYVLLNGALNVLYLSAWGWLMRYASRTRSKMLVTVGVVWALVATAVAVTLALNVY